MALTITTTGSEISTEKFVVTGVSNDPLVTTVLLSVYIDGVTLSHRLEHLPDINTTDTFSFEINSIIKDYFDFQFLALTGVNQTVLQNVLVGIELNEVIGTAVQGASYRDYVVTKNMTQDTFEIEDFDLNDYDCGDTGSSTSKLLTSSPNPLPIGDLTSVHLSCLTSSYDGGGLPKQQWVIEKYLSGVLVNISTELVSVPSRDISGYIASGKYDISNYRVDFNSADGYDEVRITIKDILTPFTARSETRSYQLNDACERSITLSWYNELGTQDTFTFLGNINRVGKYTDSSFKQVRPVNPLSTNVGDLVYKSSYNYEYDIFSDRMPESTVQWLSKVLINKRAAIQTEKVVRTATAAKKQGLLYNWFVIDQGGGGDGTAVGGIVNPSQTGWYVPTSTVGVDFDLLKTFLSTGGGGKLKETGFTNWDSPNTGATNSTKFNSIGSGVREFPWGFSNLKKTGQYLTSLDTGNPSYPLGSFTRYFTTFSGDGISLGVQDGKAGTSIRLMRLAVGGENDGDLIPNAYLGNNGESYEGVVIGTQVWITRNLYETELNDGTLIPNVTDDTAWGNLSTGALCSYNNTTLLPTGTFIDGKYFPILITTEETTLDDKFTPETLFRLKFRLANRRKGLK